MNGAPAAEYGRGGDLGRGTRAERSLAAPIMAQVPDRAPAGRKTDGRKRAG